MPELERYMLHLTAELDAKLRQAVDDFDFNTYVRALTDFCNEDLSAFYFDIRKDSLYCDAPAIPKRRAYRTVLDTLFHALVRWLAPVLVFTTEEVWGTRFPDGGSVHLLEWPEVPAVDADDAEVGRAARAAHRRSPKRSSRCAATRCSARASKPKSRVPSDADPDVPRRAVHHLDSPATAMRSTVTKTDNHKCGRCWRYLPEVKDDGDLCARCDEVVNG